ncbi:hypothetical protein ESA94_05900 [Lacibacter luteus]|uniref:Uncharacterized protein n=1 Tax=Lacibacter luteus TaxID=2508719 RepID=A0A4V1M841_9BACT|nr:hypothetical protein [Lacibacter luteus]RXK62532.1 hypothetical protein ESA94_05900 [Lacibacter luteus]
MGFYRIVSYFLLVVAVILGIAALFTLLIALANPALLISVFVVVAVVLYSVASFLFLHNGIDGKQKLKNKLRDFIKVNAYVSIVFAVMNIVQSLVVIVDPSALTTAINEFTAAQQTKSPISTGLFIKIMQVAMWFLLIYAIFLSYHISATFRYLKQYAAIFDDQPKS